MEMARGAISRAGTGYQSIVLALVPRWLTHSFKNKQVKRLDSHRKVIHWTKYT